MRAVCTICADTTKGDFAAAPCGHTFHNSCLEQWLAHQKTCPQCRVKCLKKQVLKLFLDSGNGSGDVTFMAEDSDASQDELKERLKEEHEVLKEKETALKETLQELAKVREELSAWKSQHDSVVCKLEQERGVSESLKHHMKVIQRDKESLEKIAEEGRECRRKLTTLEKIQHLLSTDNNDAHLQRMLDSASPQNLKKYLIALKNDYESVKKKYLSLQDEKKLHKKEIPSYKRKINDLEMVVCKLREELAQMESDMQSLESEKDKLIQKNKMLQKAVNSPNTQQALKRLLESPLPEKLDLKRPKLDFDSSLNGSFLSLKENVKPQETKPQVALATVKSVTEDVSVPLPPVSSGVTNPAASSSSSILRTGFNGLGGHTSFIKPRDRVIQPARVGGQHLKFAPRIPNQSKSTKKISSNSKQSFLKFS